MQPNREEIRVAEGTLDEASLPPLLDSDIELKFVEHCGVCAVVNSEDAVSLTCLGLSHLQHRGQDGGGIAALSTDGLELQRGLGRIKEALPPAILQSFSPSSTAIGHTRYGTTGGQDISNIQPFVLNLPGFGPVAIAHNGNLTNAASIRERLQSEGCVFKSSTDTELVLHLMAQAAQVISDKSELLSYALRQVAGSYSIVALFSDGVLAARDPHGNRPLVIGRRGATTIVTSEPCGWDSFLIHDFKEVPAGAVIEIGLDGSVKEPMMTLGAGLAAPCLMELLYFARPDSTVFDVRVGEFRRKMGELLYRRHPVDADLIVPLMSSGLHYALGFSEASGIPLRFSLTKNPVAPRVFIAPDQKARYEGTLEKHCLSREDVAGKRVVYVDDSIVRGVTLERIVALTYGSNSPLRAGAREVHLRIAAPPIVGPCDYGISTPTREELAVNKYRGYSGQGPVDPVLAAQRLMEELKATSLGYGALEDLAHAIDRSTSDFCTACFTNVYDKIPGGRLYELTVPSLN
jgi:amidophosphoribosyltransferase